MNTVGIWEQPLDIFLVNRHYKVNILIILNSAIIHTNIHLSHFTQIEVATVPLMPLSNVQVCDTHVAEWSF